MANFSLRELECFTAVAEELNFTAAAQRLNLSQPPLSRHIAALEDKLGAQLFHRSRRSVTLTPAGELFWTETRGILAQLTRAERAVRNRQWEEEERLEIGFVSAILSPDLATEFERFHQEFPTIRITLHDSLPAVQLEQLKAGTIELGFIGMAPPHRDRAIQIYPWRSEKLCVFLPPGHRLERMRSVPIGDLDGEPLVSVSPLASPAYHALIRNLFGEEGIQPQVTQEASRAQAVALMAVGGSAVGLLPESVGSIVPRYEPKPLLDAKGEIVRIDFVIAARSQPSPSAKRFLERVTGGRGPIG